MTPPSPVLFVYLLITLSQLGLRRLEAGASEHLKVRMWLSPRLGCATALAIVAIPALTYFVADSRSQLLTSLLAWSVALLAYAAGRALRSGRRDTPDTADVAVE
ncbi:hypothetical protein [Streptomyces sp. Ncost-T10-10d]|uniref:hypothetical protein n=1 Tax=Streptomyces sp. Ncost-T10-10d TaxID=1839774 RepID=UPI00081E1D44|nr:hypothetical protein [Streptomyces sp. Ncost-T10-10d]SCF56388.1 GABA permease [Streptomyces sp. Ncost-T10-10d]